MKTYTGTITTGIVLSNPTTQNPATLAAGGYVTNTTTLKYGDAVYGNNAAAWNFTNYGRINATRSLSSGVDFRAGGTVTNGAGDLISGAASGVQIYGSAGTLTNSGTISGTGSYRYGYGVYLAAGGSVTNTSSGRILGAATAVEINSFPGTVTNSGTISSTGAEGVYLAAGGTVINAASAQISGTFDGVVIGGNTGTITNSISAKITGGNAGVAMAGDYDTVNNFGTITGGIGVYLYASNGTVINNAGGVISGVVTGVTIGSTLGLVANTGIISASGTSGIGVLISSSGGGVGNFAGGKITGVRAGVGIDGYAGVVTNYGSISATGVAGLGVALYAGGGEVQNQAGGSIVGSLAGVAVSAVLSTVSNAGTISATGASGIGVYLSSNGGYVTNNVGGSIAGVFSGIEIDSGAGTVSNFGTISGTGSDSEGVFLSTGGGRVSNNSGGMILGVYAGVEIDSVAGTVSNSGTISGTGINSDGIFLVAAGGYVTNASGGTILGVLAGVEVDSAVGTVSNYGSITGTGTAGYGIYLYGVGGFVTNKAGATIRGVRRGVDVNSLTGTVTNSGSIIATATTGTGVYLRAGSVTNLGMVIAGTNGTGIYVYSGNVTNSGTIIATGSSAKAAYVRYGTFFNSGLVEGAVSGIELSLATGTAGSGRVTVSGTVVGAIGISVAPNITAGQTVTVSGTVTGTSGTAVSLGGLTGRLIVDPGGVFSGSLDGGGGSSVLEIAASGSGSTVLGAGAAAGAGAGAANTAAYVALGSAVNFTSLQIDNSATLDGSGVLSFDTLVNQGAINVASGDSLAFGVVASAAGTGTIDLRTGGKVTFTGSVASQTIEFVAVGGLAVLDQPGEFQGTMTEFAAGDTIDVPLGNATNLQYSGGILSFSYLGTTVDLSVSTPIASPEFVASDDGAGGSDITVQASSPPPPPPAPPPPASPPPSSPPPSPPPVTPCFCRGTLILTERGEVAVEDLAVGDRVKTLSGAWTPIMWIGFGRDLVTRRNQLARPVIVRRGALADEVPRRDLYLTHGHAFFIDGVLIPVENLVNHRSILWDEAARVVEYYHIELAEHDVVFAEGAPAETYHDAGNRAVFQNAREGSAAGIARPTFAPVLQEGEVVENAWEALFARAGGQVVTGTTEDPDLHLLVDGVRLDPVTAEDGVYRFAVERPPAATLILCSRSAVPSLIGLGRSDHRRLGVPIGRITLWQAGIATSFDHDAPQLREGGCHPAEDGYSWTDGELALPARFFTPLNGAFTLVVDTRRHCLRYLIATPLAAAA